MKYKIEKVIIIEENGNDTVKEIVYQHIDEQEFLVELLKNPKLTYWAEDDYGTKIHYRNGKKWWHNKNGISVKGYDF